MKKYYYRFPAFIVALLLALAGCDKAENKIYYEGGTAPVLTASVTTLDLSFDNADKEAVKLSWTNPGYRLTTGLSSHDVTYTIEIDTVGANFTNPKKQTVVVSKELSQSFTVSTFNDYLLNQLVLQPGISHLLEVRITSGITGSAVPLVSNVVQLTATPYAIPPKVTPPASGTLYITGSATPASWMGGGDPELISQKFTEVSATLYELPSITLTGGGSYLFVPVYGDWGSKYGFTGNNNENNVNGDDFKAGGGDMLAPAATGNYKIQVDFQRGKFTVTKL